MFLWKNPGEFPQDRGGRLHEVNGGERVFGGSYNSGSCLAGAVGGRGFVLATLEVLSLCLVLPGHLLDLQVALHQVLQGEKCCIARDARGRGRSVRMRTAGGEVLGCARQGEKC